MAEGQNQKATEYMLASISSLQSFLGLANYYQVFIFNMHNLRAPLNELLKKDKTCTHECLEAFAKIKSLDVGLSSHPQ